MLGHLLLEDLLQDCLNAFPDPGLYVAFDVMLELVLRGQAPPSSLNPQLTRRYPAKTFKLMEEYAGESAELALSLEVIYHLVEDEVFESYMRRLFGSSK